MSDENTEAQNAHFQDRAARYSRAQLLSDEAVERAVDEVWGRFAISRSDCKTIALMVIKAALGNGEQQKEARP